MKTESKGVLVGVCGEDPSGNAKMIKCDAEGYVILSNEKGEIAKLREALREAREIIKGQEAKAWERNNCECPNCIIARGDTDMARWLSKHKEEV